MSIIRVFKSGSARSLATAATLAALALLSACASNPNAARRFEGREAAQLTQGPPKAVALHRIESDAKGVIEQELVWVDAQRQRAIPARIFTPATTPAKAMGVIIFSHGLGGSRLTYSQLGRYWASQGFLSIHIQHAGSDRAIWNAPGFDGLKALRAAATIENAIARAKDVQFTLDQINKEPALQAIADMSRIAVAGHSFGASTALLMAGAQFMHEGKLLSFGDARVRAAIILSPPSLPDDLDPFKVYKPIRIPTLHLTGTLDDVPIPGLITMASERGQAFDAIESAPRYLGVFQDGRHSMFHDRSRDAVSLDIKQKAMTITTEFLNASLFGDAQAAASLARRDIKLALPVITRWEVRAGR